MVQEEITTDELILAVHDCDINPASREIFLHRYMIDESDLEEAGGVDYRMAARLIKNLSILDSFNHNPIVIHQCTDGGDWDYGMAIYDAIAISSSPIAIIAYGHARSMSSIIHQVANLRLLTPNCIVVIHHGTYAAADRVRPVVAQVERLKIEMQIMLNIYAERCYGAPGFEGRNKATIAKFIDNQLKETGDWIMSAEQAVNFGFVDGIFGQGKYKTLERVRSETKIKI